MIEHGILMKKLSAIDNSNHTISSDHTFQINDLD